MSLLQVKEVSHRYAERSLFKWKFQSKQVLSDVSFSIEKGTCLGLIGASGAVRVHWKSVAWFRTAAIRSNPFSRP